MNDEPLNQKRDGATEDDRVIPKEYLVPFVLVTTLFALWGVRKQFYRTRWLKCSKMSSQSVTLSRLLCKWRSYGGYATMAIPARIVHSKVLIQVRDCHGAVAVRHRGNAVHSCCQ